MQEHFSFPDIYPLDGAKELIRWNAETTHDFTLILDLWNVYIWIYLLLTIIDHSHLTEWHIYNECINCLFLVPCIMNYLHTPHPTSVV